MTNKRKRIKCEKCNIYFYDREDWEDSEASKYLCWNCRFIWQTIGLMLRSFDRIPKINREVAISLDDLKIRKK